MTPDTFEHNALGWIGVMVAIVLGLVNAYMLIKVAVEKSGMVQQVNDLAARVGRHGAAIGQLQVNAPPLSGYASSNAPLSGYASSNAPALPVIVTTVTASDPTPTDPTQN